MITDVYTYSVQREDLPQAILRFLPGWKEMQEGVIKPGGELIVEYETERLPDCCEQSNGSLSWDNEVYVCFHPSGECYSSSTQKEVKKGRAVVGYEPRPVLFSVPLDATQVEIWFHSYLPSKAEGESCDAWDSKFCQNYWYDVVRD